MNRSRWWFGYGWVWLVSAVMLLRPAAAVTQDEHFDVLDVGTRCYTNVTVTTKADNYIFIVYAGGMGNIKVSKLPLDVRLKLGYRPEPKTNAAPATNALAKLVTQLPPGSQKQLQDLASAWRNHGSASLSKLVFLSQGALIGIFMISLLWYLFNCYCGMLICQKAGRQPGVLVWLPILQTIPLLRAAGMSPIWLVTFFIPVVNVITILLCYVMWSFNICKARGKSPLLGVFLLLPVTSILTFIYLAFSGSAKPEAPEPHSHSQVMCLDAT
jgi:hypothetical protein